MSSFEQKKNVRAAAYTVLLFTAILLLSFMIAWTPPAAPEQKDEEGMEVNLGDSESGEGDLQPLIPGPPAPVEEEAVAPAPKTAAAVPSEKESETNDNDKEAPPVVIKKPVEKTKATPDKKAEPSVKPKTDAKKETVAVETPPAPKPKYLYKGGNEPEGKGGNNADSYQASNSQGIAGGKGDQGKINGDPNSDSYKGNVGTGSGSGISISRGLKGRKITRLPSFQDDFSENAKVAVDIKIDAVGNVIGASIQPRGTTTGNATLKNIALQKARQLKFSPDDEGPEEQIGTILFDFRIRN